MSSILGEVERINIFQQMLFSSPALQFGFKLEDHHLVPWVFNLPARDHKIYRFLLCLFLCLFKKGFAMQPRISLKSILSFTNILSASIKGVWHYTMLYCEMSFFFVCLENWILTLVHTRQNFYHHPDPIALEHQLYIGII